EYLQEARKHDRPPSLEGIEIPNRDIHFNESWLRDHEELFSFIGGALLRTAFEIPGVVDYDVRDALDALIRTYRTLQSGVYYETRPQNALAAELCGILQSAIADYRREETQRGMTRTRDTDVLRILVFLQRLEL